MGVSNTFVSCACSCSMKAVIFCASTIQLKLVFLLFFISFFIITETILSGVSFIFIFLAVIHHICDLKIALLGTFQQDVCVLQEKFHVEPAIPV